VVLFVEIVHVLTGSDLHAMPDAVFPVQLEQRTMAWTMSIQRDAHRAPPVAKGFRKNAMAALALGRAMT
jgi:hypothetical protein